MKARNLSTVLIICLLTACSTNIHPRDETIRPSKVPFGRFENVVMRPLVVEHYEGDSGDKAAVQRIDENLRSCMSVVFPNLKDDYRAGDAANSSAKTLLIEPSIVDLKKVNVSERIWLGAMAGSSAVLLKVKFTDVVSNDVVAEPTFYAKANAWGGAWTFASTDNAMLTRVANNACDYSRQNR